MHSYVVVVAKPGRRVPPETISVLSENDLADLHFAAADHLQWSSVDGTVHLAGWQAFTQTFGIGSHWSVRHDGALTLFSGHLWPRGGMWAPSQDWAEGVADRFPDLHSFGTAPDRLQGIFTATRVQPDGRGKMITDPFSVGILYWGETDDVTVVASHPRIAARALVGTSGVLERDALTSGWLVYLGYVLGDGTGFRGVQALPFGSSVDVDPAFGVRIRTSSPWPGDDLPDDEVELLDALHDDLLASIESVVALPSDRRQADITGGRDSRLILALMLEAGVTDAFDFRTIGAPHAPDAVVGARIAERFGLRHTAIDPKPMADEDFRRRLLTHVFHFSGTINGWGLKGELGVSTNVSVSGLFAEPLRSHYPTASWPTSRDEVLDGFLRWMHLDTLSLVKEDVRAHYRQVLVTEAAEVADAIGLTPLDRLDSFYVRNRLRRWAGAEQALDNTARVFPLYVPSGMRAAFSIGPHRRRRATVHFEVMRRACPELASTPFADFRWDEDLLRGYADGDRFSIDPVVYEGRRAVRWQGNRLDDNRDVVAAYLLDEPTNPVFDILDRRAVTQVLAGKSPPMVRGKIQLLGALTAAVWLGGHEHPDRFGAPPTDVTPHTVVRQPRTGGDEVRTGVSGEERRIGVRRAANDLLYALRRSARHQMWRLRQPIRRARRRRD